MRILVVRREGTVEYLSIVPPLIVHLGAQLNRFTDATGMDYFFDEFGFYEGWGCRAQKLEGII